MTGRHPIALAHVTVPGAQDADGGLELRSDVGPVLLLAPGIRHPGQSLLSGSRFATCTLDAAPRTVGRLLRVDRLISSAAVLDAVLRVRRRQLPGRFVTLRPGGRAVLPAGHAPEPDFDDEADGCVWSDVTVFIGDLGMSPGALAVRG
ncbi:hypothetical protein ACH4S8_14455 [Streptomyces sp. NPDC021080]|uniref:hypothetical protein n=1 Tax=Streptomyces sp. NPDC021080 TaxID=3365110 RepID=UPI00378D9098